tara:strand:- start:846 stop:1418 length:573 start_codon:yes stop_codon:yes gene_type:complete
MSINLKNKDVNLKSEVFGVLAEFESPSALIKAAEKVRDQGYQYFDVFSPFPIHGMDDAMGLKPSKLPWIVFLGGAFGLSFGFGLQTWVSTTAYKLVISGKPLFSYQAFIPVTFELMVLFSAFATVFGMFALNRLPQHYHPLFTVDSFSKVTSHGFFLMIESHSDNFECSEVQRELKSYGAHNIEIVKDCL